MPTSIKDAMSIPDPRVRNVVSPHFFASAYPRDQNIHFTCRQRTDWRAPIRALAQGELARFLVFIALKSRRIFYHRETSTKEVISD